VVGIEPTFEVLGQDSRWLFSQVLLLVVAERSVELMLSRRNTRRLESRGAIEAGAEHYREMVLLHGSLIPASLVEVLVFARPCLPLLAVLSLLALAATMTLRYWVIATLGWRWTTRVVCLPGAALECGGPYRWLRHPNYLAVAVEVVALPLLHSAWFVALLYGCWNLWLLRRRISVEEEALARARAQPIGTSS
jgi:methyltransferase